MPRAQETGAIIAKYFPNVETQNCDFIREGAPIRPEPSTVHWRPDAYVSFISISHACTMRAYS